MYVKGILTGKTQHLCTAKQNYKIQNNVHLLISPINTSSSM